MFKRIKAISILFVILLLIYSLLRIAFYFLYYKGISEDVSALKIFYWGFRLDFTSVFILNLPFIMFFLFISPFIKYKYAVAADLLLLGFVNFPMLALNFIDLVYYPFHLRRSNIDIFSIAGDSLQASGFFISQYWPCVLAFLLTIFCLSILFFKILKKAEDSGGLQYFKWEKIIPTLFILLLSGVLARGMRTRPIMPFTPLLYFPPEYEPLVSNSTLSFLYSLRRSEQLFRHPSWFSKKEAGKIFSYRKQYPDAGPLEKKNIVIFIMESISAGYLNKESPMKARTPFLDSIMANSIVCTNAFANGSQSNEGIVAILGTLPPFTNLPYFYSPYSNNRINGLGSILGSLEYSTHFFLGAEPDHFGFEKFGRIVGIDHFYSRKTYNNDQHYDGNWGIYDHFFLPYAGKVLKRVRKPFFASIYNISTHEPFSIPDSMEKWPQFAGQDPQQRSVSYYDFAVREFFDQIRDELWYRNTIFIFVSDHWLAPDRQNIHMKVGSFRIPLFIYEPGESGRQISYPVQQLDVIPTALEMIGYKKPFLSFGSSILDSSAKRLVYNRYLGNHQILDSSFIYGYNTETGLPVFLYNFRKDPLLKQNLQIYPAYDGKKRSLDSNLKAFVQEYQDAMIENQLFIEK